MTIEQHGTVQGYRAGCRGRGACLTSYLGTCEDAMIRYRGDYAFSKAVDAGATLAELEARDVEARRRDAESVRAQNAAARAAGRPRVAVLSEAPRRPAAAPSPKRAAPVAAPARPSVDRKPTKAEVRADERGKRKQAAADVAWARDHLQTAEAVFEKAERALAAAHAEVQSARERVRVATETLEVLDSRAVARVRRDAEQSAVAAAPAARAATPRRRGGALTPPPHGTPARYQRDCKKGSPCPASPTCHEAAMQYQRDWKAQRTGVVTS